MIQMFQAGYYTTITAESAGISEDGLHIGSIRDPGRKIIDSLGYGRARRTISTFAVMTVADVLSIFTDFFGGIRAESTAYMCNTASEVIHLGSLDGNDTGNLDIVIVLFTDSLGRTVEDTGHTAVTDARDDGIRF